MDSLPSMISGLTKTAGRFSGIASQILQDRLALISLELRESKIRFVQALILACIGVVFSLAGILLLVLLGLYILPPQWRLYGLAAAAGASIFTGTMVFIILRRRLAQNALTFDQSIAELKKDMSCFSTRN